MSPQAVERVYQSLAALAADGPVTRTAVVERTTLGHEVVRRSLTVLRDAERIRVAGRGRGGGILWSTMPEATDAQD